METTSLRRMVSSDLRQGDIPRSSDLWVIGSDLQEQRSRIVRDVWGCSSSSCLFDIRKVNGVEGSDRSVG